LPVYHRPAIEQQRRKIIKHKTTADKTRTKKTKGIRFANKFKAVRQQYPQKYRTLAYPIDTPPNAHIPCASSST
jgi:hypothetical protein